MCTSTSGRATITTRGQAGTPGCAPAALLAEAFVAVEATLGAGTEDDDHALEELSRAAWLDLVRRCPEDGERTRVIRGARRTLAPAGAAACRRAARVLVEAAGWLLGAARDADADERRRLASCADRCALAAARVQRIAQDQRRSDRIGRDGVRW